VRAASWLCRAAGLAPLVECAEESGDEQDQQDRRNGKGSKEEEQEQKENRQANHDDEEAGDNKACEHRPDERLQEDHLQRPRPRGEAYQVTRAERGGTTSSCGSLLARDSNASRASSMIRFTVR
jgi:hypothetical protein